MAWKDVREFISALEKLGESVKIEEEVDWNLEAGAMLRRSAEEGLPASLFQKIKDYQPGYRLFGNGMAKVKRIAIAMGMPPDTSLRQLTEEYINRKNHPLKPITVKNGPCKDNIITGDQVDLYKFPVPLIHQGDYARYIGTWHAVICKDPDRDWVNWSMQRNMVHDKRSCGILCDPSTHLGEIFTRGYEARNKTMDVAIAIGLEPISSMCACSPLPYGVSEVDVAGGLRGEPVELVPCETVDLMVPSTAEIVLEGEMRPNERLDEGPFGERTGYMAGVRQPRPVIHVKCITHRNNPILTMSCMGIPVDDNCTMALTRGTLFYEALKARGLPVTGLCVPPELSGLLTVASVRTTYANIAEDVAHVIWGSRLGHAVPYIVVVDDDVDPFNINQWLHALVSRCHPSRGINKLENTTASFLFPFLDAHERRYPKGAKAYFDCTWPKDWNPQDIPKRASFTDIYPPEVQNSVIAKWQKLGY